MRLLNQYSIQGPNIYSYHPVIVMEIDLEEYTEVFTDELDNFITLLLDKFPGLKEHYCSKGYPGGFVERLERGTLLGHVIEHLAIELQCNIYKPVNYGKTRFADEINGYRIIYSYLDEALGLHAGKLAFQAIKKLAAGGDISPGQILSQLEEKFMKESYGPSTRSIIEAARERNIPVLPLSDRSSLIQLGYGSKQKRVQATITGQTSCIGVDLACDKWEAKNLLLNMGLPINDGYLVGDKKQALAAFDKLKSPVVVKPLDGNQGKGVTLSIETEQELIRAYQLAQNYSDQIIIEEYVEGNDYRIIVVDGKVVATSHRVPPYIVGDGIHSIRELIRELNQNPRRGEGHEKPLTRVKIDPVVLLNLARQDLSLDSVLPSDEKVYLRENGNLSTGGLARDVTQLVHPVNKRIAERAARIVGLDVVGIDLRTADITRPISQYGGAIIEMNAAPGIRMHHYPSAGKKQQVADKIVEMLIPEGDGRIPIFSVTGTNGKTTTVRLLQHILSQLDFQVGMTTTDGIFIGDELIYEGDTTGPKSARMLLQDPDVDIAVLETARGGLLRAGLGYDKSDVGICLNVSEDHLYSRGIDSLEDMAYVKSVVVETVKKGGVCILNGDNPYTREMAEGCLGQIIYFSQNPVNPIIREHLQTGGVVVVNEEQIIKIKDGDREIDLISVREIPMTYDGKAYHQIENILAAVAGLYGYGISLDIIREGLLTFAGDFATNPGRLNLFEYSGRKLIFDYGHNLEGYRSIIDFAQQIGYNRLFGVVGIPGDRPDESIKKIGKLAGESFNRIWIKEDGNLRGRQEGEVAQIIKKGIEQGQTTSPNEIILDEKEAFRAMLEELQVGDIGVIFFEKDLAQLFEIVENYFENIDEKDQKDTLVLNSSG